MTRDRLRWPSIWRRLLFFGLTFLTSLSASALMADILRTNGFTPWEKASLIVFFAWPFMFAWLIEKITQRTSPFAQLNVLASAMCGSITAASSAAASSGAANTPASQRQSTLSATGAFINC